MKGQAAYQTEQATAFSAAPEGVIQFAFNPILNLSTGRTAALFCVPNKCEAGETIHGYHAIAQGMPSALSLDINSLDFALAFTRKLSAAGLFAAVGTSVSYKTLAQSETRQIYLRALSQAGIDKNPLLLVKIDALPQTISVAELADVVQHLRPLLKRIYVHLPQDSDLLEKASLIGAAGFTTSLRPDQTTEKIAPEIARLARDCACQAARFCVDNIQTQAQWDQMARLGVHFGAWQSTGGHTLARSTLAALRRAPI